MIIKQQQNYIEDLSQNNYELITNIKEFQIQQDKLLRDLDNKDIEIQKDYNRQNRNSERFRIYSIVKLRNTRIQYDYTWREQEKLENKYLMMSSEIESKYQNMIRIKQNRIKSKFIRMINQLNEIIDQKNIELENIQKVNTQYQLQLLENEKQDYKILEKTGEAREKEVENWRRRFQKLTQDQEKLYNEKLESNKKLTSEELEIEIQKRKITSNESELNLLRNIISQLNVEIERLRKSSDDLLQDNEGWRQKYSRLFQQIPSMLQLIPLIIPGNSFRKLRSLNNNEYDEL